MKILAASISVEAQDDVTPEMLRAILVNHLYFALSETEGGMIHWDRVRVFVGDRGRQSDTATKS